MSESRIFIVPQVPGKVLESVKHWNHLSFAKLPAWMKDNEFIKFYHRPELNSVAECFKSILGVHSETGDTEYRCESVILNFLRLLAL